MSRSWTQIVEDARAAADAAQREGRPLRVSEIAERLRRRGRRLSDKQVEITLRRAQDLGLLHRRGAYLWDAGPASAGAAVAVARDAGDRPAPQLLVLCARRMLELAPSADNNRAVRRLLDLVAEQLPATHGASAPAGHAAVPAPQRAAARGNGEGRHDDPEVEVLLSAVT